MDWYKQHNMVQIQKLPKDQGNGGATREKGIRLYCTMADTAWTLQIRGPLGLGWAGMKEGKDVVIAGASLDRATMEALRDQINAALTESV